ncbi:DENN domain-containing protein 3-like [Physella acuta]|uniref:DENN domain-containing protein 3-like n=1 Tax=Physella acuta TaxID=109671 RepID=UPI0027DB4C6B|nr:DENN domain-containing protein 3-like [Physella acuta]
MSEKLTESVRGPALTLYNRFAELMLVVGLDENTGLVPGRKDDSDGDRDDLLSNLFDDVYEAQVLAAISASKALVFQPHLMEDPTYPPAPESVVGMNSFKSFRSQAEDSINGRSKNYTSHRTVSVNPSVIKQHLSKPEATAMSKAVVDLPLSKDAIEAITTFCFPENVHVFREKPDNSIHFLVLTDVSGSKTYASCLTFYKPYKLTKESNGNISYTIQDTSQKLNHHPNIFYCYIPQCCVLVSKYPYFYAMKECLSCMISHVERDLEEMFQFLKDFTYTMTMSPVPPAGNVVVEMTVFNLSVSLFPTETPEKPVLDLPLHLTFLCFPVDELLKVFTAILCEERLVFVSFNYALLTTVMESFLYYILPFSWRFTYVPILSASSLELLEAPGTFMMGCHSKHLDVVEQVEGLVVANIDEGTVTVNASENMSPTQINPHSDFYVLCEPGFIPNLPVEPANLFKKICKRSKFQMELSDVQRPFCYDIEEEKAFRMKKCMQFNTEISFAFLEMMVNLFRGTLAYLKIELRRFNKQQFIESVPECDKPFYERVLNTDMFKQFLEDRLNEKFDYWSDYEIKTRPYAKKIISGQDGSPGLSHRQMMKPTRRQVSITTFSSLSPRTFEVFRLPPLNDSLSYAKTTMDMLNKNIDECRNLFYKSSYLYLRGMFHAAEGNVVAALDDLLSLHANNAKLLPIHLVRKLLQLVPEAEREEILRKKGVLHMTHLAQDLEHEKSFQRRCLVDKIPIPDNDLSLEEFVEAISLLEMANDYDTIQRLFLALAQPWKPTHVEKYTFEVLRLSYEENQVQCESLSLPDECLQANETVLRVSNLIKTDFGMGRIVLTDKRLFFIKDVSNRYREVVKLRNITKLEKLQNHSFLMAVDVLVIIDTENKVKFTAWLKEERNCWAAMIDEMRAGKIVAEATKDYTAISQAIQNVLLVDAVIKSGHDERTTHHSHINRAAEALCYFTAYMSEGRHNLPRDTITALQHRVDPNAGQRERKTVEVLLYTAGYSQNNVPPRLWCGMGDGKVRVFDATNWSLERSFVQAKNTVSAMLAVGDLTVWVGSYGIYIIDTETIRSNKTLTEHSDLVSDMVLSADKRNVYSSSVDGTIIKWEVQTLRKLIQMRVTESKSLRFIRLYDDKLWCGTWQKIIALDTQGTQLQVFSYAEPETGKLQELDCFEIFNDEIWAGCRRTGQVVIWDEKTTKMKQVLKPECRGISCILLFGEKVWVATKDGTIYIYHSSSKQQWKTIKAHEDAIRSLCAAESRYIMSGAGSKDGKVAIWSPNSDISEVDAGLCAP